MALSQAPRVRRRKPEVEQLPPTILVEFEIPGALPSRANSRQHWATRARQDRDWLARAIQLGLLARQLARLRPAGPETQRRLELTVYRCRLMDPDNLTAAVKPVVDGLKLRHSRRLRSMPAWVTDPWGAGLIHDDDDDHLVLIVTQERCRTAAQRVAVRLTVLASLYEDAEETKS